MLPNGKVLVLGGYDGHGPNRLASSELYDPASGKWTNANSLAIGRTRPTTTLLSNRLILVAAGHDSDTNSTATCELYDPTSGTWMSTGAMATARGWHTATLLLNGKVLVAAGHNRGDGSDLSTAELYDPDTGKWSSTGSLSVARDNHTATLLFDGRVLVNGGDNNGNAVSAAELYDPATGTWKAAGAPRSARTLHTATLLANGNVLIAAGYDPATSLWVPSAERYDSAPGPMMLLNPIKRPGGGFQFAFTSAPHGAYSVVATTDLALPLVYLDEGVLNWTVLLPVPEFSPGLYFFGDPEAANSPQRFYQVVAGLPCQGPNPCPCAYQCVTGIWSHYATCRDCFYEP